MVFEHIPDVEAAWRNVHKLLKPGGVALAFFPTLYALPVLINHLIPERLSRALLFKLRSERGDNGGDPKFPACYDWCFGSERKLAPMLRRAGFSDFVVQPFWGYGYLDRIPVLRMIDHSFNRAAAKLGIKALTSYAWVLARK
jgi:SAM-dependent methyltransferase